MRQQRNRTNTLARNLIALGVLAATTVATAQIEEVVVTATKRAESLQDVPISPGRHHRAKPNQ